MSIILTPLSYGMDLCLYFFEALNCCGCYNFLIICINAILVLVWINFELLTTWEFFAARCTQNKMAFPWKYYYNTLSIVVVVVGSWVNSKCHVVGLYEIKKSKINVIEANMNLSPLTLPYSKSLLGTWDCMNMWWHWIFCYKESVGAPRPLGDQILKSICGSALTISHKSHILNIQLPIHCIHRLLLPNLQPIIL